MDGNGHRPLPALEWLCRACRAGLDPRNPVNPFRELHLLCDPVTQFCSCPCDTGELDDEGGLRR